MASPAARPTAPVSARLMPLALLLAAHPARGETGLMRDVVFADYTPLSSNLELARRLLTPLAAATLPQRMAGSGKRLAEQPIELSEERFIVYVPAAPPRQGYGLLAFVPPWPEASLPPRWAATLDRQGVILVSAGRSSCQRRFREHAVDAALVCLRPGELHDAFRRSHRRRRRGPVAGTGSAAGANANRAGQARALSVDDRVGAREELPAGGSAHC